MVTVLPKEQSLGELLGSGLGAGVSTGLQQKMEMMFKEQAQQKQLENLSKVLGLGIEPSTEGISETQEGEIPTTAAASQQSNIERIATNPQAMMILTQTNPQLATQIQSMYANQIAAKKASQKADLEERKFATTQSQKYTEKINEINTSLPDKRIALTRIRDALDSNDLKSFRNFYADYQESKGLPGEYFRTSSGAALISATKEFLLGDIARIKGGRPNQFIEKQLSNAYTKAGYSKEANEKIFKAMQTGLSIAEKESEIYEKITDEFESKGKPIPGNIAKLVNKELKPFVLQKEKELSEYYNDINKKGLKMAQMRGFKRFTINGKVYKIADDQVEEFKRDMGVK